jgi:hypothetical protein
MDHLAIIKRMWKMLWSYRALWVFGVILALTTSAGGGSSNSGAQASGSSGLGEGFGSASISQFLAQLGRIIGRPGQFLGRADMAAFSGLLLALGVAVCGLGLLLAIVGFIARYVAETALIRMVDEHEATGERKTIGQGFRLGWSRAALRLFLIGLVVTIPIALGAMLLFGLALLPLLTWVTDITALGVLGTVVTIGLFFLVLLFVLVVAVVAHLVVRLAWRAATLEDLGVIDALRRAWGQIWGQFRDVGLMWLIMLGVRLGYGVLMVPVGLIILLLGGAVSGVILLLVRTMTGLFATGAAPWIVGALLAAPAFILIVFVPFVFLRALYLVSESGVWTLTFRELVALEALAAEPRVGRVPVI